MTLLLESGAGTGTVTPSDNNEPTTTERHTPMRKLTPEELAEIRDVLPWIAHADCVWMQVGPCVYCVGHDVRLYNGTLPLAKRRNTTVRRP